MNNTKRFIVTILGALFIVGCNGFFGKKSDLSFIDKPVYQDREVAYVPIQPVLDNFVKPSQVLAGFDELIYVVDQGSSEIISFDISGRELGRLRVPGLYSIAMDRAFDILAIGTFDTTFNDFPLTLNCIYRINQKNGTLYGLQYASLKPALIHPLYNKTKSATRSDQEVQFLNIACLGDNTYYVTRQGPNKTVNGFGCNANDPSRDVILQIRPDLETGEQDKLSIENIISKLIEIGFTRYNFYLSITFFEKVIRYCCI